MKRIAISSLIIKENTILLVKKKNTWILPGGKPDQNETDAACLFREHGEELPEAIIQPLLFYKEICGTTPHKGDILCCRTYFTSLRGSIKPGMEISQSQYFTLEETKKIIVSDITKKILLSLSQDDYLM